VKRGFEFHHHLEKISEGLVVILTTFVLLCYMTYEEAISLGWKDRDNDPSHNTFVFEAEGFDYHIMSIHFNYQDDFDLVMIKCVPEKTTHNIWENSECHFYGQLKTKQELYLVMQLVGVIEYKGL